MLLRRGLTIGAEASVILLAGRARPAAHPAVFAQPFPHATRSHLPFQGRVRWRKMRRASGAPFHPTLRGATRLEGGGPNMPNKAAGLVAFSSPFARTPYQKLVARRCRSTTART